jgi:hypothetical protein
MPMDRRQLEALLADSPAITKVVIDPGSGLFALTFAEDAGHESTILLDRQEVSAVTALVREMTAEMVATGHARVGLKQAVIETIGRDPWR